MEIPEFSPWPKITRFNRDIIVTEKLDGTNAQIHVNATGDDLIAGSRTRWITPEDDNFGFARWVQENKAELLRLGPGSHFGEWWGSGIQRGYGRRDGERTFSLFNGTRWEVTRPTCCSVVPTLWMGKIEYFKASEVMAELGQTGSRAAGGFMKPEGIVIFHTASGQLFKKTFDKDDAPKGLLRELMQGES